MSEINNNQESANLDLEDQTLGYENLPPTRELTDNSHIEQYLYSNENQVKKHSSHIINPLPQVSKFQNLSSGEIDFIKIE
jgi:hypothetical protein